jgi:hypothetical protein
MSAKALSMPSMRVSTSAALKVNLVMAGKTSQSLSRAPLRHDEQQADFDRSWNSLVLASTCKDEEAATSDWCCRLHVKKTALKRVLLDKAATDSAAFHTACLSQSSRHRRHHSGCPA